ncbi:hypothetical protein GLA29479_268 [Lysobacter antibioticus]|nr:hypothetical protein GLA29479_268 [Lysobacter antibioticus]
MSNGGLAETALLSPLIEASNYRRVGATQVATASFRSCGVSLKQDPDPDQTPRASATKAAGYFLLS